MDGFFVAKLQKYKNGARDEEEEEEEDGEGEGGKEGEDEDGDGEGEEVEEEEEMKNDRAKKKIKASDTNGKEVAGVKRKSTSEATLDKSTDTKRGKVDASVTSAPAVITKTNAVGASNARNVESVSKSEGKKDSSKKSAKNESEVGAKTEVKKSSSAVGDSEVKKLESKERAGFNGAIPTKIG